jgi:DNA-directed RNA polymerase subunit E'/Rpb7
MKNNYSGEKIRKMHKKTLRQKVNIHPSYLNQNLEQQVFKKLDSELTGTCTYENGYVICVERKIDILNNQLITDGHVLCDTEFTVRTLKPFVGQVLEGTACMIFADGIFVEVHKMKVLVPANKIKGYKYDETTGEFVGEKSISQGQDVKVKLDQIKYDQRGFNCIGVLT